MYIGIYVFTPAPTKSPRNSKARSTWGLCSPTWKAPSCLGSPYPQEQLWLRQGASHHALSRCSPSLPCRTLLGSRWCHLRDARHIPSLPLNLCLCDDLPKHVALQEILQAEEADAVPACTIASAALEVAVDIFGASWVLLPVTDLVTVGQEDDVVIPWDALGHCSDKLSGCETWGSEIQGAEPTSLSQNGYGASIESTCPK